MECCKRDRLLIVDDEDAILVAMREYFSMLGFDVDCARQRKTALALLEQSRYAVVIADLRLTGSHSTEGFEVADEVRDRWPRTRVVLLTAYGSPRIEREAHKHGVDALLFKPHPLPDLATVVLELCDRAHEGEGAPACQHQVALRHPGRIRRFPATRS